MTKWQNVNDIRDQCVNAPLDGGQDELARLQ